MLFLVCKIIHVIGNVLWLGGGAAAAFSFVLLGREDPKVRLAAAQALRKIMLRLVSPGMNLSLGAGLIMLLTYWSDLYAKAPWMHAKLTVGLIAAGFSGVLSGKLRRAAEGSEVTPGAIKLAGAVLILSAVANVCFVILRFGQH
jgi:uncharacterized membrane protein